MIFSLVKSDLFMRTLLLDRIFVTKKTTRKPRVHLVNPLLLGPECHLNFKFAAI